jgi:transposase
MEGIFLSVKDQIRYRMVEDFRSGKISRHDVALKLGISERQVTRIKNKIRKHGIPGLIHGNRQKKPHNKYPCDVKDWYLELYRSKYPNFNFRHALEMINLHQEPKIKVSYGSFRKWCRQAGLGKVRRRRASKARVTRERSANEGFMLQMDGSTHRWFGKEKTTLIATIDDATSDIPGGRFFPSETTWGCLNVLEDVIINHGVPEVILTDEAGWSTGGTKRESFSQFARACDELGIKLIGTPSAESKGRIERLNRTLQDRLIPEMELYGVNNMVHANQYLNQCFIPNWRENLTVKPISQEKRYRQLGPTMNLKDILCYKYKRMVNRGHEIFFEGEVYRIDPTSTGNLWRKEVCIHKYQDNSIAFFHAGKRLPFDRVRKPVRKWQKGA